MGTRGLDAHGHQAASRQDFSEPGEAIESSKRHIPLAAAEDPQLKDAIAKLAYLTPVGEGRVFDKGKSGVLDMSPEELRVAGLVPETWSLEVVADAESGTVIEQPLERGTGTALDWSGLMRLADKQAVRFLHPCLCTNVDDPLHVDVWEGVPLREVIWMAEPRAHIRRVYYQSYHPESVPPFQASLPLGHVLETPPGQVPVVLAYRMNGQLIPASQGGPVRVVVPGTYGNKSIKWVQRIVLTNDFRANDSDAADFNSDTDTPMKTKARFIDVPSEAAAGRPVALTGFVLIGISGVQKVQYCVHDQREPWPQDDPYWTKADWKDAEILPPPASWGGGLEDGRLPADTSLIDPAQGTPLQWPMRFTIAHWAALLTGLPTGSYDLCCRAIDGNGIAQPMPRPLLRTGANHIHRVTLTVTG
jgi:DMSO/TMAO reductase YedYZ molybdopterin-dependent catalytic subunit